MTATIWSTRKFCTQRIFVF